MAMLPPPSTTPITLPYNSVVLAGKREKKRKKKHRGKEEKKREERLSHVLEGKG